MKHKSYKAEKSGIVDGLDGDDPGSANRAEAPNAASESRSASPGGQGQVESPAAGGGSDQAIETPPTLDELRGRVEALEDALLRAKADFQNLQRRSAQEYAQAVRFANAELMRSLLGVVDDFERSMEVSKTADDRAAVVEGLRLVFDNLMKELRSHGLEPIEALNEPFDPHVHEAVLQQPSADAPPGVVLHEIAKGYRLGERVLRPAKVVVSRAAENADAPNEV